MSAELAYQSLLTVAEMVLRREEAYDDIGVMAEDMALMNLPKGFRPMTVQQIADLEADPLQASVEQLILYNMMLGERLTVAKDFEKLERRKRSLAMLGDHKMRSRQRMNLTLATDVLDGTRVATGIKLHTKDVLGKHEAMFLYEWAMPMVEDEVLSICKMAHVINHGRVNPLAKQG